MDIKIGYKTFKVIYQAKVRYEKKLVNGFIDTSRDKILIDSSILPSKQDQVLIHEILHGIEEVYNTKLTEKQTDVLATGIISVIKDNKELIKKLIEE
jgi:hypothetical protein